MTERPGAASTAPPLDAPPQDTGRRHWRRALHWLPGLVLLVAVVYVAAQRVEEERALVELLSRSRPWWLVAAAAAQVATYATAAAAWRVPLRARGERLSFSTLMEIALLKLTVDQAIPTGGMSGVLVVARQLRRLGVARDTAAAAILIAAIGYYLAYAAAAFGALAVLWLRRDLDPVVASIVSLFGVLAAVVPLALAWLLGRHGWRPPAWLRRVPWVDAMFVETAAAAPLGAIEMRSLGASVVASFGTFVLDAATLAMTLLAVGAHAGPVVCFAALVLGQVASTLGVVPGGLGTFEAVAVATLASSGIPMASALSAVLLLRAFTFWLPLVPGLLVARRTRSAA